MTNRRRKLAIVILTGMCIYAITPFVAGLLKTYDRSGPKVFLREHHEPLYTFGYYLAGHHHHDGKPREPFMQDRPWFYGLQGERIPEL